MTYSKSKIPLNIIIALALAVYGGYKVKKQGKDNNIVVMYAIVWFVIALIIFYLIDLAAKKLLPAEESGYTNCRPGTCPHTRSDGTIFCTSAACKKSSATSNVASEI